jgi:transposase-like protein
MVLQQLEPRMARGYAIIAKGDKISEVGDNVFSVPSQSGNGNYIVSLAEEEWSCTCPDHQTRNVVCKHIHAVRFLLALNSRLEEKSDLPECKWCGSKVVIRYGTEADKQVFKCKDCDRKFVVDEGFKKMHYEPKIITISLDLYFKGTSLRKISDHLKQFYGLNVHFSTLYRWIGKYVKMIGEYADSLTPQLSGKWNVDEMKLRCKGDWVWLWNVMDKETRFLLASTISEKREVEDARKALQKAQNMAKSKPITVTTDGLQSYQDAFKKEFFTLRNPRTEHVRSAGIRASRRNNNVVERLNGTVRERNKVMRGLKKEDTPITKGFEIYYNFVKPHQSLNGQTPAQKAGIGMGSEENKWLALIQNANLVISKQNKS